ncbi:MAG: Bax inhibitor-1 family protein [Sandaracinaceae bacterium]
MNTYAQPTPYAPVAAQASVDERAGFIARTYVHLGAAILAFVALEVLAFQTRLPETMLGMVFGSGRFGWLVFLGLFMAAGWVANSWAQNGSSPVMQYAGLALYTVAEVVLFMPLLLIANLQFPGAIESAALVTLVIFGALTGVVFLTRKDFSFLRTTLMFGAVAAFAIIVFAILFNFQLGVFFMGAMCVLAGGYILYYTSNVLHHYRTDQHVAAALALFSAVALLFWYVLQLFMSRR